MPGDLEHFHILLCLGWSGVWTCILFTCIFHEYERVVGWGVSEAVPHSSDGTDCHSDSLHM